MQANILSNYGMLLLCGYQKTFLSKKTYLFWTRQLEICKTHCQRLWKSIQERRVAQSLKIPPSIEWDNYLSFTLANKICVNQLPDDLFTDFLFQIPLLVRTMWEIILPDLSIKQKQISCLSRVCEKKSKRFGYFNQNM